MQKCVTKFQIPDARKPIPKAERGLGPSGELMAFAPTLPTCETILGRRITQMALNVGTYGMGGPGFFGLKLDQDWLVISVWGASEWIHVNGRLIRDDWGDEHGRPTSWIGDDWDALSSEICGQTICAFSVQKHAMQIRLDSEMTIEIKEACDERPLFQGSKEPRQFSDCDDLRQAVFLSPTTEIWV